MTVFEAYKKAWQARTAVLPLFVSVRLLSLAVIAPLTAASVQLALSLSGQPALTDQDIAYFIFSPLGFVAFIGVAGIVLVGSIVGLAAMTVNLRDAQSGTFSSLRTTINLLVLRFRALMTYAVLLVLRVLAFVAPFAALGLSIAERFFGEFDINYYLSTHPPEFLQGVALIAVLVVILILLLLNRLLSWAVSLHLVIFDNIAPARSFSLSAERMYGQKKTLLLQLTLWFGVRVGLLFAAGLVFGGLMTLIAGQMGGALRLTLTLALMSVGVWTVANLVIAALSLGALARVLFTQYAEDGQAADLPPAPQAAPVPLRLVGVGAVLLIAASLFAGSLLVSSVQAETRVEIIAHRGAAGARPENTLASVQKAVDDGADWVEIDVQETADGHVVVMHDSDFMKQAGVDLKIWDATLDDLSGIDIGSWFAPEFADERTAMLSEVLEITRDQSKLLIELKYYGHDVDLEARTIAVVEAAGMADQVATMSLKYPAVQKMKGLRPDWDAGVLAATALGDLTQLDADFIAVSTASVGPRLVRAAESAGKKLYVWTVNDAIQMSAMISLGVDGLITDEPALARDVLEFRAGLSTAERVFLLFAERFGLDQAAGGFAEHVQ